MRHLEDQFRPADNQTIGGELNRAGAPQVRQLFTLTHLIRLFSKTVVSSRADAHLLKLRLVFSIRVDSIAESTIRV